MTHLGQCPQTHLHVFSFYRYRKGQDYKTMANMAEQDQKLWILMIIHYSWCIHVLCEHDHTSNYNVDHLTVLL